MAAAHTLPSGDAAGEKAPQPCRDPAQEFCDAVIRPMLDSSSPEPVNADELALYIGDELDQARGKPGSRLSLESFRRIRLLVMRSQEWAAVHSKMLQQRLASEASAS